MLYVRSKAAEEAYFKQIKQELVRDGGLPGIGSILERSAGLFPSRTAIIFNDLTITYAELYRRAVAFSRVLQARGIKPRDRVLLLYENSIDFYSAYYGIAQCGAVIAPLNTFLKERELTHIINDAQPVLMVVSPQSHALVESLESVCKVPVLVYDAATFPGKENDIFPSYHLHEDELAALLYTSGTTGLPKGVMLSSKNCMSNVLQIVSRVHLTECERVLGVLPLFHSFAQNLCLWSAIFLGCTVIVVPKIDRRAILAGLQHKPTLFLSVPALFGLLCLMKNAQLGTIKWLVSGGDAIPDRIRAAFALIYRRKICSGYGLTEASPVVSVDLEDVTELTNNAGEPLFGVRVQIRDESGAEVPQGAIGALWVAGDNIMLGYYNEPAETAKVLVDGWLDTGDLGYIDERGKIVITGRLKDLIIHKGFNIYPQEIENVIASHPNVVRVGVIGRPDEAGEVPVAYVQIKEEEPDAVKHLNDLCVKHLAAYKVPREFIVSTAELSLTATSKVDKKVLRVYDAQKNKA